MHEYRPPLHKRIPEWHCGKKGYPTEADADDALGEIWARPRGDSDPMEAHTYRCPRHAREVWHLTSQDRKGRTA